jgi:RNA-directed DNA polymerase
MPRKAAVSGRALKPGGTKGKRTARHERDYTKKFIGGPSPKSVKRVCREVHELTHSRNVLLPVETVVERVNRLLKGWGAFYSVGYPSRVFRKVNHYVLKRMARFLNRKSQRYYRLKFADTYYGEMTHYGLYRLAWADVRRAR